MRAFKLIAFGKSSTSAVVRAYPDCRRRVRLYRPLAHSV